MMMVNQGGLPLLELGLLLLLLFNSKFGVLLFCPRELEVESGISSEGRSHPWQDFFEFEAVREKIRDRPANEISKDSLHD